MRNGWKLVLQLLMALGSSAAAAVKLFFILGAVKQPWLSSLGELKLSDPRLCCALVFAMRSKAASFFCLFLFFSPLSFLCTYFPSGTSFLSKALSVCVCVLSFAPSCSSSGGVHACLLPACVPFFICYNL